MILEKRELRELCKEALDKKINESQDMLASIDESAHDDTKSSAGDKFETSREMLKQEAEKISSQLGVLLHQRQVLSVLDTKISDVVVHGSLVKTDKGIFYLSISLGKVLYQHDTIYAISDESPMALALVGRRVGDKVIVNSRTITILDVC